MGCIPSNQLEATERSSPALTSRSRFKSSLVSKLKSSKGKTTPSIVVEAPWVEGHRVLVLDDYGNVSFTEQGSEHQQCFV